ncbi:NAD(P)H-dependent oxidoreductase [Alkaliphilus sp. MSJ-5]|uniref:NAD(P)H-dependent oxidoreductase n=1 Tax=Alkaliphilus flagellatus TaxID=2841507 RepID=A0ABS6G1N8_9FIRM|nr:NAD(P)H-dependent oxidoreductase [Alkaliphilus flagellatus]MBU5676401.1 NAD(P)H-dependent oxidoreductase [Alkaliphilus flagellatus]
MLREKKALLLIGSPKLKKSASESLGSYLLEGLYKNGYKCNKLHIISILKNDVEELFDNVNDADILIVSSPLYVDSLPSPLIKAFELIGDNRKERESVKKQSMISIVNSGFPESFHNDTALKICKNFADKADFDWLGGLAMGGGPAINGMPIKDLGGMTRNIVKALDMTIESITNNKSIPLEATDMMSSKLIPIWLYTLIANRSWKTQAKKFNVHKSLYAKPYIKG